MKGLERVSASKINSFLRCGEKFRRVYINKEISKVGIQVVAGRAVHKAISVANERKMAGRYIELDEMVKLGIDNFTKNT